MICPSCWESGDKSRALQTLARGTECPELREAFGVRAIYRRFSIAQEMRCTGAAKAILKMSFFGSIEKDARRPPSQKLSSSIMVVRVVFVGHFVEALCRAVFGTG